MTAAAATLSRNERRVPVRPVSQTSAVRSEWIKLTTLRSTWITLAAAMLGTIIVGAAASWDTNDSWDHLHPDELLNFSAVDVSLTGVALAQLAIAVLGVLVISGEYATGMIRSTLAAVPRRLPVLWAKLAVFGVMVAAAMAITTVASFLVGQAFLKTHGTSLGAAHVIQSLVGATFYLIAVAVIAVAIGFIVRSTAGGIAAVVALLLVIPGIGDILPASWQTHVLPYLPSNAGAALYTVHPDPTASLTATPAVITLLLWCIAAVTASALVLRRRDA